MSEIVWLASYPKSGNTWLRAFLSNYRRNAAAPTLINELEVGHIVSARSSFEELVGVESSDLTPAQIEACRPMVYRLLAKQSAETYFMKVHDAYRRLKTGEPLFPTDITLGVVYLIRHPCDVAVSYAHHNSQTMDVAIACMNSPRHTLAGREDAMDIQLSQTLLTWSEHVRSWLDSGLNCHVARYEDMLANPFETFGAIVRFVNMPFEPQRVQRAVEFSRFEELQAQEQKTYFRERPSRAPNFFRQGKAGAWRDILSAEQVAALVQAHGDVMRQFGYLDPQGNVL